MTDEITVTATEAQLRALLRGERDVIRVRETKKAPNTTPISEVGLDETHDLMGVVRSVEDINEFTRDDGEEGQVRNIRVQDRTGDIRVALWGEKAETQMDVGDYVHILSADIQSGYQDKLEASVGYGGSIQVVDADPEEEARQVTISKGDQWDDE